MILSNFSFLILVRGEIPVEARPGGMGRIQRGYLPLQGDTLCGQGSIGDDDPDGSLPTQHIP